MNFEELAPELQERLKAVKTIEELAELAKAEGVDLSVDQLKAVSGGMEPNPGGMGPDSGNKCLPYCFADAPQPCVCYDDYNTVSYCPSDTSSE